MIATRVRIAVTNKIYVVTVTTITTTIVSGKILRFSIRAKIVHRQNLNNRKNTKKNSTI